jgi:predicted transcriptional regulator
VPRYSTIRLPPLRELARQLRFAPKAAALRQVAAVLELADEIDPGKAYSQGWLTRRITGFRANAEADTHLVGEALLADLSAFVERLSAQARLGDADLDSPVLSLRALAERWRVTPRTLERYRRKGLIGLRLRPAQGGGRLVFIESSVRSFESRFGSMLEEARAFSRASPDQRARLAALAAERAAASPAPLNRAARDIAPAVGLSAGTVRRILREDPASRILTRSHATPRQASTALRLWREGMGASDIARSLGVTRLTAHRLIDAERERLLRSLAIEHALVERPARVLDDPLVRLGLGEPGDTDAVALAAAAAKHEAPDAAREKRLAAAHHLLLGRVAAMHDVPRRLPGRTLDEIETLLRWAVLLRVELLRSERALIIRSIEERARVGLLDLPPVEIRRWTGAAFAAAAAAVDRFDPSKRGRLATPISLALARALAPLAPPTAQPRRAHAASVPIADWSRSVAPWQEFVDAPDAVAVAVRERLVDDRTALVIRCRFGWGVGPPMTLRQMHREHGVSPAAMLRCLRLAASQVPSTTR